MYGDSKPEIEYANSLLSVLGAPYSMIYYATTGTMAIEAAIKIAKSITNRKTVLGFDGAFHGVSHLTLSVSGMTDLKTEFNIPHIQDEILPFPNCTSCKKEETEVAACEGLEVIKNRLLEIGESSIAAIIAEPFLSAMCREPCKYFWPELKKLLTSKGILLIGDEVSTGFGRCGSIMAFQQWSVSPDIVVLGKSLAAGYVPLAVVATTEDVSKHLHGRIFKHGSTFDGHPLSCAAAKAFLDFCTTNDWLEKASSASELFYDQIVALFSNPSAHHSSVRIKGLLAVIELTLPKAEEIKANCRNRGIIIGGFFNYLRIAPGILMDKKDLSDGVQIVYEEVTKL